MSKRNGKTATVLVAGCLVAGLGADTVRADGIKWAVINNFGLFANADTQERFKKEFGEHLACMAKRFSPGQCDNRRSTFGLTQQPYAVRFDGKAFAYEPDLLHPRDGGERDSVMVEFDAPGTKADQRCDWTVGGRAQKAAACQGFRTGVKLGDAIEVTVDPRGRGASSSTTVNVKRVVIATFGDSFMSGEGNPHRRSRVEPVQAEVWLEPRCHRSLLTASAQAAFRFADANPQSYVAYYNFACSGSTGQVGVLGAYGGVMTSRELDNLRGPDDASNHFRGDRLPTQLEQAKATFCTRGKACVAPDVVFLSIGINTLKFSDTITDLGRQACDRKCQVALEARVKQGIETLLGEGADSLDRVYQTLSKELQPKAAFAIEYPDPTRKDNGGYCDANALFPSLGRTPIGRIDAKENQWAHDNMLEPLNAAVATAVSRAEGWQLVRGTAEVTRRHGYCADKTFFNSGQAAKGSSGTMHPNVVGHDAVAKLLGAALERHLAQGGAQGTR
jgi:hypothetical protein